MEKIRIIGLDLDGTLLNNQKKISPRTYQALERVKAQGVFLVPVTGRPRLGIPKELRRLPVFQYLIACNGASTWNEREETLLHETTIDPGHCMELAQLFSDHKVAYEVLHQGVGYAEQWVYDGMIARNPTNVFLPQYIKETRRIVPSIQAFLAQSPSVEEMFVMMEREKQQKIAEEIKALAPLNVVFPASWALEITAPGVDKGSALLKLGETLGISPQGVMAIGDSGNDLAMLKAAGLPVAMENATDQVKALASHVTASNEEDGVALAIERFVLEQ